MSAATTLVTPPVSAYSTAGDPGLSFAARYAQIAAAAAQADALLAADVAQENQLGVRLTSARARALEAESATFQLNQQAQQATALFEARRVDLKRLAVASYVDEGNNSALASFLSAHDVAEFSRRSELAKRVANVEHQSIQRFHRAKTEAEGRVREALRVRNALRREVTDLETQVPAIEQAVAAAQARSARVHQVSDMWSSVRDGPATPIMGRSVLTASELAGWFQSTGAVAHTTVSIDELAQIFLDEGAAENVRGDIAFAQSIVETGYFAFPDYGQDHPNQNNFAGIGACDSCPTGRSYPDARTGVRAQIQLLRFYADPTASVATLHEPLADPGYATFGPRGWAPTWASLTGRWATSTTYGDTIFATYARILSWATDHNVG